MNLRARIGLLVLATVVVLTTPVTAATLYVNAASANPVAPYSDWSTAATNIANACIASHQGDIILVTNGTYTGIGGSFAAVAGTNTIVSVNGAQNTIIDCKNLSSGVRVYSNSVLDGFTILHANIYGVYGVQGGQVYNCIMRSNLVGAMGGSYFNCTISESSIKSLNGGAIFNATMSNCIVAANSGWGGPFHSTLYSCIISNNAEIEYNPGAGAYQCILSNCVVIGNVATNSSYQVSGGGTYQGTNYNCLIVNNFASGNGGGTCESTNYNCIISGNVSSNGGGAFQSTLYNCVLSGNTASRDGGGIHSGNAWNCTVVKNTAGGSGGGVYGISISNSIILLNSASSGSNWVNAGSQFITYCCTMPIYASGGGHNITNDPGFVDADGGNFQLKWDSPCIDAVGAALPATASDIRGTPRPLDGDNDGVAQSDMGAYEYDPSGDLSVGIRAYYTNFSTSFSAPFVAQIVGHADPYSWDFGDGTLVTNQSNPIHAWAAPGQYNVKLLAYYPDLDEFRSATIPVQVVQQPVFYVNPTSPSQAYPYTTWASAAHQIQPAIDASTVVGRLVLITNSAWQGYSAMIVLRTNPVIVMSVNGPSVTTMDALSLVGRCASLNDWSVLSGFTLKGGLVWNGGDSILNQSGGALWCAPSATVSNCFIAGNKAWNLGGGAYGGNYYSCVFSNNSIYTGQGGAAYGGTLHDCTVVANFTITGTTPGGPGAGVSQSTLYNCLLVSNRTTAIYCDGGGAYKSTLFNCVLSNNTSGALGGGADLSSLYNCTIVGNRAGYGGGGWSNTYQNCILTGNYAYYGGATCAGTLVDCIVTKNSAICDGAGITLATFYNCTIVNNRSTNGYNTTFSGINNDGIKGGFISNSIVYYNWIGSSGTVSNFWTNTTFRWSCSTPMPPGVGNITNEPCLVDWAGGDFRLRATSRCIDAGTDLSALVPTDFLGTARPLDGNGDGIAKFDMGAYEFNLFSTVGTAWLTNHGLNPNDPLVFMHDPDGDGFTTLQEWIAGTDPTNALSALQMTSPNGNGSGVDITWQSVAGISYQLERSTNLFAQPAFSILATNLTGLAGTTTYTDTSATNGVAYFYRVGVP